jgi:hypothetical protein
LTVRLCKILGRKRTKSSPSSSASISLRHIVSPHRYAMSPRRQDSEETLFDGSSNDGSGYDKLDCVLPTFFPFFFFRPANSYPSTGVPLDPFLIVQPSLDDTLLVKQGLVEETVPPPPTHNPHDIQVCFVFGSWLGLTGSFVIGSTILGWPEGQYVVADEIPERNYFYFNPTVPVTEGLHILCYSHARLFSKRG